MPLSHKHQPTTPSKRVAALALAILTLVGLASGSAPALAHDDGLTCHSHPSSGRVTEVTFNFIEIKASGGTGKTLAASVIAHDLNNQAAANPDLFLHSEVTAAQGRIGEFEHMVRVIASLVGRAERLSDPREVDEAMALAQDTLDRLPLARYVDLASFLETNRPGVVVLSSQSLVDFLRDAGTPEHLVASVESAASDC